MNRGHVPASMTSMKRYSFIWWLLGAMLLSSLLAFKPLTPPRQDVAEPEGVYVVSKNRIADNDGQFNITDKLIWRELVEKGYDPSLDMTNKQLTLGTESTYSRCTRCHECGFKEAWDWENYWGENRTEDWNPTYSGEEWRPVVNRMRKYEGAHLNESIGDRIFSFLRDETLGVYDEASDPKGAIMLNRPPDDLLHP